MHRSELELFLFLILLKCTSRGKKCPCSLLFKIKIDLRTMWGFFQFFVAKNICLVRMKFMKFKWILQSLTMPMVCVNCMIYASPRFEYYWVFYDGAHEVLDAFQLLKKKQILQFKKVVVPCPAVVFPLWVFVKKGKILSPRCIREPQNEWDSCGGTIHVRP